MLKPVPKELVRPGFRLPGALCDESGHILLSPGTCLTQADIDRLAHHAALGLYADCDWRDTQTPATSETNEISIDALRAGMRLSEAIYDDAGVLLLAEGNHITHRFLHLLHQRGITCVRTQSQQPQHEVADSTECVLTTKLDEILRFQAGQPSTFRPRGTAGRSRLALDDLRAEVQRGLEKHTAATGLLAEMCDTLKSGKEVSGAELREAVDDFEAMIMLDADLLPLIVNIHRAGDRYPFDHCVNSALVSMTMAAQLGMNREQIKEVGLGAMLQDVGMVLVPDRIRSASRAPTDDEWFEIRCHPYYTLDFVERIRGLPLAVGLVGYQVHERADASGYPRQRSGMLIHPYARIASIADAYVAMTRPRPYRPPMLPYAAAKTILLEGSANKFDRDVVRGFLDSISLFPIGSMVELDDGMRATVIRANPGLQTRPVIEEVDADERPTGAVIDLSKVTDREIVRAVTAETSVDQA